MDNNNFSPKEFLFFNRLIMPTVITFIYWIILAIIVIIGLYNMSIIGFFYGLIFILFGFIITRISFELICVIFSINRNLEKLVTLRSKNNDENENKTDND